MSPTALQEIETTLAKHGEKHENHKLNFEALWKAVERIRTDNQKNASKLGFIMGGVTVFGVVINAAVIYLTGR